MRDRLAVRGAPRRADGDDRSSLRRELHGVREQVVEDLLELGVIGLDLAARRGATSISKVIVLARRHAPHDLADALDRRQRTENVSGKISILPASTFDRSRMSLMIDEQVLAGG